MNLELSLQRIKSTDTFTIGALWNGNERLAWTMEDAVRPVKIQNETAIPAGHYRIRMTFSNRFQKLMPLLMDVPGFAGVRIHGGNTQADTDGCILVGLHKTEDTIYECAPALEMIYNLIAAAETNGGTWITINDCKT